VYNHRLLMLIIQHDRVHKDTSGTRQFFLRGVELLNHCKLTTWTKRYISF